MTFDRFASIRHAKPGKKSRSDRRPAQGARPAGQPFTLQAPIQSKDNAASSDQPTRSSA
jgi:hypothetical protein